MRVYACDPGVSPTYVLGFARLGCGDLKFTFHTCDLSMRHSFRHPMVHLGTGS